MSRDGARDDLCRPAGFDYPPPAVSGRMRGSNALNGFMVCGWYAYEAVLAGLMAASAGGRTWLGRVGMGTVVIAVYLLLAQLDVVGTRPAWFVGGNIAVLAAGVAGLVLSRRSDTRQIALLLAASAAVPVALSYIRLP